MLVLTRRTGESIMIGDDVRIVVLDVRGDTVRLGIDAPRSIQVHRAEVYAEVQAANAAAANAGDLVALAGRLQEITRNAGRVRAPSRPRVPRPAAPNDPAVPAAPAGPAVPSAPAAPAAPAGPAGPDAERGPAD